MDLVSLYVDQVGANDLSRERAARFPGMKIYPTIAEALTRGGSKLAVDGVVLLASTAIIRATKRARHEYPRYEFFEQIVSVFAMSGRTVPLFSDKHLSWKWEWAQQMYDTSREMGFRVHGRVQPAGDVAHSFVEMPWRCVDQRGDVRLLRRRGQLRFPWPGDGAVHGGARRGGETGVRWIQAYRGDKFWGALREGVWSND